MGKEVGRRHKDGTTRWRALGVGAAGNITALISGEIAALDAKVGGFALVRGELKSDTVTTAVFRVDVAPVAVESLVGAVFNLNIG